MNVLEMHYVGVLQDDHPKLFEKEKDDFPRHSVVTKCNAQL